MFVGLAIVCDEFFVPSLEDICKIFGMKEDVAGATFMAAGSSAPELATTVISLFVAKDVDIGIGTVVGSAVFNIMFVISFVALLSGAIINLNWYPMIRDSIFYLISVLAMILVIMDEKVYWYEALSFIMLYGFYITIMIFNTRIEQMIYTLIPYLMKKSDVIQLEGNNYSTLKEDQNLETNGYNSNVDGTNNKMVPNESIEIQSVKDENEKTAADFQSTSTSDCYSPFVFPSADKTLFEKFRFYICWPLMLLLFVSIPNSRKESWRKFYMLTFFMSLVWLSLFSYVMVWMITIIGYTFGVPDTVMGITFIAFGASVPDALSSLLVAKNGFGDMAVSNAIGSNVFDILICLGVPWLFSCITIVKDSYITVKSKGLTYSSITLFGTVIILVASIHINKWQLDKKLGIFLMVVYLLFILLASLYELNIIGSNHLPMCLDSLW